MGIFETGGGKLVKKQIILLFTVLLSLASCTSSDEVESSELVRLDFESIPEINIANQESYTLRGTCLDKGLEVDYIIQEVVEPPMAEDAVSTNPGSPFKLVGTVQCEEDGTWEIGPINLSALSIESKAKLTFSISGIETSIEIVKDAQAPTVGFDTTNDFVNAANEGQFPLSGYCSEDGTVSYQVGTVGGETPCTESEGWSVLLSLSQESPGALAITVSMRDLALNPAAIPATGSVIKDVRGPEFAIGSMGIPDSKTYYRGELNFYVEYDEVVIVPGPSVPRLILGNFADGVIRYATYVSGSGSTRLNFSYEIGRGDRAAEGVSVADSIDLDGGDAIITDLAGNRASVKGLVDAGLLSGVIVDNTTFRLLGVSVASENEKFHGVNNNIPLTASFSRPATIHTANGNPELILEVGTESNIRAPYSGSGTVFTYTVAQGENDNDGIQVVGLDLKGGSIRETNHDTDLVAVSGMFPINGGRVKVDTEVPLLKGADSNSSTPVKSKTWSLSCVDENDCLYRFVINQASSAGNVLETATYQSLTSSPSVNQGDGLHYLHVQVKDTLDNELTPPKTAVVLLDNTAPRMTAVTPPSDGVYDFQDELQFILTYHEDIQWTGTNAPFIQLTFADGVTGNAVLDAPDVDHDGNPKTLRFIYQIEQGVEDSDGINLANAITIPHGSVIRDSAGNDASLDLPLSGHLSSVKVINLKIPTLTQVVDNLGSVTRHKAGDIVTLVAHFSEVVTVALNGSGSVALNLQVGSDSSVVAVYEGSDGDSGNTHNFSYTVGSAHWDDDGIKVTGLTLSGGATISHSSGGNLDLNGYSPEQISNVLVDGIAPGLATTNRLVSPAPHNYFQGQNLDFIVNFDEDVNVVGNGLPFITLAIGTATKTAEVLASSNDGDSSLTFRYTVQAEDADFDGIQLTGGITLPEDVTIQDLAGNLASSIVLGTANYPKLFVNKAQIFALEKLSLQEDTSCVLMAAGGIQCWGEGYEGRLGNGQSSQDATTPVAVKSVGSGEGELEDIVQLSSGARHACALTSGGPYDAGAHREGPDI